MGKRTMTVIPGDGIGPEITEASPRVLAALVCDFDYDERLTG